MDEKAVRQKLLSTLSHLRRDRCGKCGRVIDEGDMTWNGGSTEYGTPYSVIMCICQNCDSSVFVYNTWDSDLITLEDVCEALCGIDEGDLR